MVDDIVSLLVHVGQSLSQENFESRVHDHVRNKPICNISAHDELRSPPEKIKGAPVDKDKKEKNKIEKLARTSIEHLLNEIWVVLTQTSLAIFFNLKCT